MKTVKTIKEYKGFEIRLEKVKRTTYWAWFGYRNGKRIISGYELEEDITKIIDGLWIV